MKDSTQTSPSKKTPQPITPYSLLDVCPACGTYTPDGEVCNRCLKPYGLDKKKITYIDF